MKKYASLLVLAAVATACGSQLVVPSEGDVSRIQESHPEYTMESIMNGKTLYADHCGKCHGLKKPSDYTEAQWNRIVPNMVGKVNKNGVVLTDDDQSDILRYVVTLSKPAE